MALYAFDGTGNEDQDRDDRDSNVIDFFSAYIDPNKNTDPDLELGSLYMKGIGTRARTFIGRGPAEAFGYVLIGLAVVLMLVGLADAVRRR